jgi:hypothetical protein
VQEGVVGEGLCSVKVYGYFWRVDPEIAVLIPCQRWAKKLGKECNTLEQRLQLQDMTSVSVRAFVFTV